jgi:bacterioferritin-associated ferredoxin
MHPLSISSEQHRMYVCLCKGITDTQIRSAIQDGATSFKDVRKTLGVASQCGKCGIMTREILRESQLDACEEQSLFYALT